MSQAQISLFQIGTATTYPSKGFDPLPELPPGIPVSFDTETTGLNLRGGDRPFCFNLATAEDEWCCAWNENWLCDNLADRDVVMAEAKFDIWSSDTVGVNLEAVNARPHDIQHAAALIDDHRHSFSLDALGQTFVGRKKLELPHKRISELPVSLIVPYGRQDARLTYDVWQSQQFYIKEQGLEKVLELEDALIYSTLAMQRGGVCLDVPKLERWCVEVDQARVERLLQVWQLTGLRVNPDSPGDMKKLFRYLGIEHTGFSTTGGRDGVSRESFSDQALQEFRTYEAVRSVIEARELKSWLSKCGHKYLAQAVGGKLYFKLHQLRTDEGGTITGRYSGDIQQVPKPDKQAASTKAWPVRELFIGEDGSDVLDTDASQIEFRLFAHFSCIPAPHSTRLIKAYNDNPDIDFHDLVTHDILKDIMIRSLAKNVNFAKLYGGGVGKIALMTGQCMVKAKQTVAAYDRAFPEAGRLLNFCTKLAERRGYVKTALGRRRRYLPGDRFYSALNSILQGTAAEIMKLKVLALYQERKVLGGVTRFPLHDELVRDKSEARTAKLVAELLAEQALKLRVPITWNLSTGKNWLEAM